MKIGFIGCGNMGQALARGIIAAAGAKNVLVMDNDTDKAKAFCLETQAEAKTKEEIIKESKYIFLAVKPQVLPSLAEEIRPMLKKRNEPFVLVSMAAGIRTERIKELFGDFPVIRIMPNLPVSVGEGMILLTHKDVSSEDIREFDLIMNKCGNMTVLDEELFDSGTSVSGCGPAFVCLFASALAKAGVSCGLSEENSLELALQTVLGTAKLLKDKKLDPNELKTAVCSPGGSTIEGVKVIENSTFEDIVLNAVNASYKRNKELGQ